jgi:hypothetical protein
MDIRKEVETIIQELLDRGEEEAAGALQEWIYSWSDKL